MKNSSILCGLVVLISLLTLGCQTNRSSKYSPENKNEGYNQFQASGTVLTARFSGNNKTSPDQALMFSNFRAIEICREMGKKIVIPLSIKNLTSVKDVQKSSNSSYQSPTYVNSYSKNSATVTGGNTYSSSSSWTEQVVYPAYDTNFICADDFYSSDITIREVSSEDMKGIVTDLLGAVQMMAPSQNNPNMDIGDFIIRVNGKRVQSSSDYVQAIQSSNKKVANLIIIRDGLQKDVVVNLSNDTQKMTDTQGKLVSKMCMVNEIKSRSICKGGIMVAKVEASNLGESVSQVSFEKKKDISEVVKSEEGNYPELKKTDMGWRFGFGLGYIMTSDIEGSASQRTSGSLGNSNTKTKISEKFKSGIQLSANLINLQQNSTGMISAFEYTPEREFDGGDLTVTSYVFKASIAARGENLYAFAGGNLSFHKGSDDISPMAGQRKTSEATGGPGFQVGLGSMLSENMAIELELEQVKFDYEIKLSNMSGGPQGQSVIDIESYIKNLKLAIKFLF